MFEIRQDGIRNSCEILESAGNSIKYILPDLENCISQIGHISQMEEVIAMLRQSDADMQREQYSVKVMQESLIRIGQSFDLCETRLADNAEGSIISFPVHLYSVLDFNGFNFAADTDEFVIS